MHTERETDMHAYTLVHVHACMRARAANDVIYILNTAGVRGEISHNGQGERDSSWRIIQVRKCVNSMCKKHFDEEGKGGWLGVRDQ